MSNDEIRRRKTADAELDAINVIAQALAPLDTETCKRILDWATDRFIEEPKRQTSELAWTSVSAQIEAYQEFATKLGIDDRALAHALKHSRQMKGLAPIQDDPDPEATLKQAVETVQHG